MSWADLRFNILSMIFTCYPLFRVLLMDRFDHLMYVQIDSIILYYNPSEDHVKLCNGWQGKIVDHLLDVLKFVRNAH